MRELRRDPTTGDVVIISSERLLRPNVTQRPRLVVAPEQCPFCPGNEDATPPTLAQWDDAWTVRAFPNKFPALGVEGMVHRDHPHQMGGVGAHEVVVECPEHDGRPRPTALVVAQRRMRDLCNDQRLVHRLWFRNHGPEAGATQSHPHAQILATPLVPPRVHAMAEGDFADVAHRAVFELDGVEVFCPWAPLGPFETWLRPTDGPASFLAAGEDRAFRMAVALQALIDRFDVALDSPSYNAMLFEGGPYPWHVRVQPRIVGFGGFEHATGMRLHGVPPEEAAAVLARITP